MKHKIRERADSGKYNELKAKAERRIWMLYESWFLFNLHKMNGILKTEVYSMNGNSVEFRNQAFVGVVEAVN